jgi:hypothetical protein
MENSTYPPEIVDRIVDELEEGKSLVRICCGEGMPSRRTVQRWADGSDDLAQRLRAARELGYLNRAEQAVEAAKNATDPIAGRLAFDAERWYLGKLSVAFHDKPVQIGAFVNVDADAAFGAIRDALDRAAAGISSRGDSTRPVVIEGKARPADPGGGLADMAGLGGQRLGEDQNRG